MIIINKVSQLVSGLNSDKNNGKKIAFVPTMGSLHDGHLSLIKKAAEIADIVVVSIFVNEAQFNNKEDYAKYPRNIEDDISKLKSHKVDYVFNPSSKEILDEKYQVKAFLDEKLAAILCGKNREGHFAGVVMIVSRFFNIIKPDFAIFGEKDFQQLRIIEEMTKILNQDLALNIKIVPLKIMREESGLAMSSRNLRLSDDEIIKAENISKILEKIRENILQKNDKIDDILQKYSAQILDMGFAQIDYLEVRDEKKLQLVKDYNFKVPARIFIAVYLGKVRLIDNILI